MRLENGKEYILNDGTIVTADLRNDGLLSLKHEDKTMMMCLFDGRVVSGSNTVIGEVLHSPSVLIYENNNIVPLNELKKKLEIETIEQELKNCISASFEGDSEVFIEYFIESLKYSDYSKEIFDYLKRKCNVL